MTNEEIWALIEILEALLEESSIDEDFKRQLEKKLLDIKYNHEVY